MKILMVGQLPVEAGGLYTDGVCNVVYELSKAATTDIDLVVYATNMKDSKSYRLNSNCSFRGSRFRPFRILVEICKHPLLKFQQWHFYKQKCYFITTPIRNELYRDNISRLIKEEKPDMIHCMNLIQLAPIHFAAEPEHLPVILTLHGVERSINSLAHNVIPLADYITGLTAETMEGIKLHGANESRIEMIPNGTDVSKFYYSEEERNILRSSFGISTDVTVMITVGSLQFRKGQLSFIERLNSMPASFKYIYMLIGSGPDEEKIRQYIKSNIMEDKVKIIGYVDNRDLYKYYSAADVYIHGSYSEGQALSEIEAYATDLKVAVNKDILGTIVTDTSNTNDYFIFEYDNFDYHGFANWACSKKDGRKTRNNYSWVNVFKLYLDLYKNVKKEYEKNC